MNLVPAAFMSAFAEVGGKILGSIKAALRMAFNAGTRTMGIVEEKRFIELLNTINIDLGEGEVSSGVDEAANVRAKLIATIGWEKKGDYSKKDLELNEQTEKIVRDMKEYYGVGGVGGGREPGVSVNNGKIERFWSKLTGSVVEVAADFEMFRSQPASSRSTTRRCLEQRAN